MKKHVGKLFAAAVVVAVVLAALLLRQTEKNEAIVFIVRQGDLPITVTEGGSIEALESQEIRSEVKGYQGTKILSIVEEGFQVTEADVKDGKVLVELDSSELKQKLTTQDIQLQSTLASLTEAQQAYDIQYNQNKTDIKAAEQKVRFARMDLEKFLGDKASKEVLRELGLDEAALAEAEKDTLKALASVQILAPKLAEASPAQTVSDVPTLSSVHLSSTNAVPDSLVSGSSGVTNSAPPGSVVALPPPSKVVDFTRYAKLELLGDGEAKQKLRKIEDDLLVAKSEFGVSKNQYEGSQRLAEKGFVTRTTLQNEEIAMQKNELKVQTADTAHGLFIKYEFPKTAEELLSKYEEAVRLLERTRKEAISKLAQAQAKLKSAEGRYNIEKEQRRDLQDQVDKCTIRAKKTGLVVYGGGQDGVFYYGQEQIREGATVRERQPIITIPDMTKMSAKVKIHESHIKKVKKGMKANIRVDAFANEVLTGDVIKVGVLPDSQNRWVNPDLKVYLTSVQIQGVRDWLKPGMSAKVEILVSELTNVVHVPIQAVSMEGNIQVCYVMDGARQEKRVVETGEFNDEFIQVKQGLKPGEKVLLRTPSSTKEEHPSGERKEEGSPAPSSTVSSGPA